MNAAARSRIASLALLGALVAVTLVLVTPFCGVLHRCGCRALWAGGESRCNFSNPTGPHCPWCEYRSLGGAVVACMIGAEALAFAALRKRGASRARAALAAAAAGPLMGVAAGAVAWALTDYPHFLVLDARARIGLPAGPISTIASGSCCGPRER